MGTEWFGLGSFSSGNSRFWSSFLLGPLVNRHRILSGFLVSIFTARGGSCHPNSLNTTFICHDQIIACKKKSPRKTVFVRRLLGDITSLNFLFGFTGRCRKQHRDNGDHWYDYGIAGVLEPHTAAHTPIHLTPQCHAHTHSHPHTAPAHTPHPHTPHLHAHAPVCDPTCTLHTAAPQLQTVT